VSQEKVLKKVKGSLLGVGGNAFCLIDHFKGLAKQQGFNNEFINDVLDEAQAGDYSHLIRTLSNNMQSS
jgi:hypothetical protein